jgi:nickel/cobalt transporter (NicO) family protein
MNTNGPALLAAAAGVAFGHAILPDHWLPLAVLGRTRRYRVSRVARLSCLAGVAHVLVSIALGTVIIAVGLQFRSSVEGAENTIVGALLLATGLGFIALELSGRGHAHAHEHRGHGHRQEHDHDYEHVHRQGEHPDHGPQARLHGLAAVMVPFGAAASPDLTILPVFVAATAAGVATAVGSIVIFAAVTVGTIVGLTVAATLGGYQVRGHWLERWGNAFTALVLVVIGALVLIGVI